MPRQFGGMMEGVPPFEEAPKSEKPKRQITDPLKMESFDHLKLDIDKYKILSKDEFDNLWRRWKDTGDRALAEEMVGSNVPFVIGRAKFFVELMRARGYEISMNDLIQEGTTGLFEVLYKYNPDRYKNKFITYAAHTVNQRMRRFLIDHGSNIRIPAHVMETLLHEEKIISQLRIALDREPTREEIIQEVGADHSEITERARATRTASLDKVVLDEEEKPGRTRHELVHGLDKHSVHELASDRRAIQMYESILAGFSPVQVFYLKNGPLAPIFQHVSISSDKRAKLAFEEGVIPKVVTRERVSQITKKAMKKFVQILVEKDPSLAEKFEKYQKELDEEEE